MATLKYSRQREVIKEYLASTKEHPTADTVYLHVRKTFPKISLGTVYRNLNLLSDTGEALKITTPDGGVRFDATTTPHYHVLCCKCGCVQDLDMKPIDTLDEQAQQCYNGIIRSHSVLFNGICSQCSKELSTH